MEEAGNTKKLIRHFTTFARIASGLIGVGLLLVAVLRPDLVSETLAYRMMQSLGNAEPVEITRVQVGLINLTYILALLAFAFAAFGFGLVRVPLHWWLTLPQKRMIAFAIVLILALRLFSLLLMPDTDFNADSRRFNVLAHNMIYDGEYKWSSRHDRPDVVFVPGWPVLLAGVYKVFGIGHHVAVIFGMLFSLAIPFLLYGLARLIWSEREGRLAMLAGFLIPSYGLYHLSVLQEVLFVPLAIAIAWSAVLLVREFSYPRLLLLAALVCFGTYERQSGMAFLFLPPAVLLFQWPGLRTWFVRTAFYIFCTVVILSPWIYRCSSVAGGFVFMTDDVLKVTRRGAYDLDKANAGEFVAEKGSKAVDPIVYLKQWLAKDPFAYFKKLPVAIKSLMTFDHLQGWHFGENKEASGLLWKRLGRNLERLLSMLFFLGMVIQIVSRDKERAGFRKEQWVLLATYAITFGLAVGILATWPKYIYPVAFVPLLFSARLTARLLPKDV